MRRQKRYVIALTLMVVFAEGVRAQMLHGDPGFPVLNELKWEMSMQEVQSVCRAHRVLESANDTSIVIALSFCGFSTRTEIRFDQGLRTIKLVQARFKEPTKAMEDTLLQHLTKTFGTAPFRTAKEKSVLIVTIRMQIAVWRLATEVVNLVTAMRGDSIFDVSLVLFRPTKQQDPKTEQ